MAADGRHLIKSLCNTVAHIATRGRGKYLNFSPPIIAPRIRKKHRGKRSPPFRRIPSFPASRNHAPSADGTWFLFSSPGRRKKRRENALSRAVAGFLPSRTQTRKHARRRRIAPVRKRADAAAPSLRTFRPGRAMPQTAGPAPAPARSRGFLLYRRPAAFSFTGVQG